MTDNMHTTLSDTSFCRNLPREIVDVLSGKGETRTLPAHTVLFKEGEMHDFVYLVLQGRIVLDIFVQGRGHVELQTLSDGEFLGWSPLIMQSPMSVRATTLTDTVLAKFKAEQLRELCEQNHEFGYYFMKQVAAAFVKRLRATRIQMLDLFAHPNDEPKS
ncbi:MAG: cyclic nucleotide-binding domain-containing protein [Planctomycetaceae bacterium]|nr:cyclic nucleotide-binding domain-containing protein [Planctomycetaceae bacterium]MCB9949937.1 cyclic nucleotide-binding domain-containing protein [Planctomycetaceae bacterium]